MHSHKSALRAQERHAAFGVTWTRLKSLSASSAKLMTIRAPAIMLALLEWARVAPARVGLGDGDEGARRDSCTRRAHAVYTPFGDGPAREPSARSRERRSWRSCRAIAYRLFRCAAFVTREIVYGRCKSCVIAHRYSRNVLKHSGRCVAQGLS
jgi:hypothetical protein